MLIGRRQFLLLSLAAAGFTNAQASEPFWAKLRSGNTIDLLRHAAAPGTGDPPGFARRLQHPTQSVLVTHQYNITGLTGEAPARGEMIVARISAGRPVEVVSRVPPPF